jgi:hypothetical protein
MNTLKIKSIAIFLFKSQYDFTFVQFLPEILQLFIKLIIFKFIEVIDIVKDDDHHFVFDLWKSDLSVIVKFSNLIEFVSKNISVLDTVQINIKVKLKDTTLN